MFTVIFSRFFQRFTVYHHKCDVDNLVIRKHVKWKFIGKSGYILLCVFTVRPPRSPRSKIFHLP